MHAYEQLPEKDVDLEVGATKLQAQFRGNAVRKGKSKGVMSSLMSAPSSISIAMSSAATKVQASYRGRAARSMTPESQPAQVRISSRDKTRGEAKQKRLRAAMASHLFPDIDQADAQYQELSLSRLEEALAESETPEWRNPPQLVGVPQPANDVDFFRAGDVTLVDQTGKAITLVQSQVRGMIARRHVKEETKGGPQRPAVRLSPNIVTSEAAGGDGGSKKPPGTLQVRISHATGLKVSDCGTESSDPYVVVKALGLTKKTPHVPYNINPHFDHPLHFSAQTHATLDRALIEPIELNVWDYDLTSQDDHIGKATLDLSEHSEKLNSGEAVKVVAQLSDGQKVPGTVYLVVSWDPGSDVSLPSTLQTSAIITLVSVLVFLLGRAASSDIPWIFSFLASLLQGIIYYTVMLLFLIYLWLRLPFILGFLASELITRLALFNYPLRISSLRVRPWLQAEPLRIYLDLHVSRFRLANLAGCLHDDFVFAHDVHLVCYVGLGFLGRLLKGKPLIEPIIVRCKRLVISGVELNLEMSTTGVFNIPGIVSALAMGELRQSIGGIGLFSLGLGLGSVC